MCLKRKNLLEQPNPKRKDPNRPLLLPRIKDSEYGGRKRKRLLKKRKELKKHQSEIQEAHEEKWLQSTGRFPQKRWRIEQKRTLKTWFEGIDKDNSGEIDVNELADPLISTGLARTLSEVTSLVRKIDDNQSSGIDFQEFLTVIKKDGEEAKSRATQHKKSTSSWNDVVRKQQIPGAGSRKKKKNIPSNPIVEFTRRQHNEHMDLESVLIRERRKLLLDATMMQAERREKALEQISRWRQEMVNLTGASRLRKLHEISSLIKHLEADRVENESFVYFMKGMLSKIQKDGDHSTIERERMHSPARQALMKRRNVSILRKISVGSHRKAVVYPMTWNRSFLSLTTERSMEN